MLKDGSMRDVGGLAAVKAVDEDDDATVMRPREKGGKEGVAKGESTEGKGCGCGGGGGGVPGKE